MFRKIDCVMIYVPDLDAAAQYYVDVFGMRRLWREASAVGLGFPETDAEIVLHTDAGVPKEAHYLVDNVVEAVREAAAKGCKVIEPPFDIAIGKCAVIEDPFGTVLCILDMTKGRRIGG
jgi:lactoylglutathione lyase